ncbi:nitroreductase family protein [Candidatus Micrarchaeota archaeon]|nr:nitroreductase family protein [Candidatus Micrarchaeota archaeon]
MDFFDTVDKRRSTRAFQAKEVDVKTIKQILDTVNLAPSAGDLQAYRISIVKSKKTKEELMSACLDQEFVAQASVVFIFSADKKQSEVKYGARGYELYAVQDATIAAAYCQLAATALGLACAWVGAFDPLEVSRIINAEPEEVPVAVIPVGYPNARPSWTGRKELKELVRQI